MDIKETQRWGKIYIKYLRRREARNRQTDKTQRYKGNSRQSKERRTERKTKKKD
jgi:hypothetical protein